jgi:hypothetical protein
MSQHQMVADMVELVGEQVPKMAVLEVPAAAVVQMIYQHKKLAVLQYQDKATMVELADLTH